jgi:hypothetical protein
VPLQQHPSNYPASFSGETLAGVIQEPLDKIRIGRLRPDSIHVRILVPDTTVSMANPCQVDDLADSPESAPAQPRSCAATP